ncbi:MAG TPA: HlyD family secretion protein [Candidatus Competibacteraceae bacterium]|nr:HlyD family secretion protein [Candidatus Competibacteraceae bacterium]
MLAAAGGIYYYRHYMAPFESTDDAFIEGHVTPVAPQVAGRVIRLLVKDNQEIKQGDLLLEIDPRDYEARLSQSRANLAAARSQLEQAKAQVAVDQATADQQRAAVVSAKAEAARAQADLQRYQSVERRAVSRSQLDLAETQAQSNAAAFDVARNRAKAAEANVTLSKANVETAAAKVQQAEAALRQAELDLSYTKVIAPEAGRVTRRTIEQGAYVQPGQQLLALVPDSVWVVANYKETQLTDMRPGQPVDITVDAYPDRAFTGKVDSIQAGTGARFSLLPPENAVGNYVKVVQRVPVKIVFDGPLDPALDIAPGMSVVPKVRVR